MSRWPRMPTTPLWTSERYRGPVIEPTSPNSRFGATRDIGKQLARVRRELARIATALWALAIVALLALCTWLAQLMAATR